MSLEQVLKESRSEEDRNLVNSQLMKLHSDLQIISEFLQKDLRISKFKNSEGAFQNTVDNLEELEDKKLYHEWVEKQGVKKQKVENKGDEKQQLFDEIE